VQQEDVKAEKNLFINEILIKQEATKDITTTVIILTYLLIQKYS